MLKSRDSTHNLVKHIQHDKYYWHICMWRFESGLTSACFTTGPYVILLFPLWLGQPGTRKSLLKERGTPRQAFIWGKKNAHESLVNADETSSEADWGAWKMCKALTTNSLRNLRAKKYMSLVEGRLSSYKIMRWKIKIFFWATSQLLPSKLGRC
jgi:hypothetical protein